MTALTGTFTPPGGPAVPAQPAVPATGVAVQNPNTYPVTVVISANGATITNVTVNGLTVGTAAGTYTVPAAGTISIAYTVATPTWVWSNALGAATPAVTAGWDGAATPTLTVTTGGVAVAAYSGQANATFAGVPQSVLNAVAGKNVLEALPA